MEINGGNPRTAAVWGKWTVSLQGNGRLVDGGAVCKDNSSFILYVQEQDGHVTS